MPRATPLWAHLHGHIYLCQDLPHYHSCNPPSTHATHHIQLPSITDIAHAQTSGRPLPSRPPIRPLTLHHRINVHITTPSAHPAPLFHLHLHTKHLHQTQLPVAPHPSPEVGANQKDAEYHSWSMMTVQPDLNIAIQLLTASSPSSYQVRRNGRMNHQSAVEARAVNETLPRIMLSNCVPRPQSPNLAKRARERGSRSQKISAKKHLMLMNLVLVLAKIIE